MSNNLSLWDSVSRTDPNMTKPFSNGTYSGTAIDPQYQAREATDQFGPFGKGWGLENEKFEVVDVDDDTKLMFYHAELWFILESERSSFPVTSGIKFVYKAKSGRVMVDADATKKLQTNAISKGLSRLGFSADIFLGKFDDELYVWGANESAAAQGDIETIDANDALIIAKLVEETGTDEVKFFEHYGVKTYHELSRNNFASALRAMRAKKAGAK